MSERQVLSIDKVREEMSYLNPKWLSYSQRCELFDTINRLCEYGEHLQAECAAMRDALQSHQWTMNGCPSCNNWSTQGHRDSCHVAQALSSNAGAQWLERYKAMERLYRAVKFSENIRSESFPLLASDEEQDSWLTEWESRLHPADDEMEAALAALEAMNCGNTPG